MFCNKCGEKMEENSEFCTMCGAKVKQKNLNENVQTRQAPVPQRQTVSYSSSKKDDKQIKTQIVAAVIIVMTILGILYVSSFHTCDFCNKVYIGSGYYDAFGGDDVMCKNCAKDYYPFGYEQYKK